jgi:hypothetical protein
MSIISQDLVSANLKFAINNMAVTLTAVTPTNDQIYIANRQSVAETFMIMDDGREESIDTRFYIATTEHDAALLPKKGWILTDGSGKQYKVENHRTDAIQATHRIECKSRNQR